MDLSRLASEGLGGLVHGGGAPVAVTSHVGVAWCECEWSLEMWSGWRERE